jgi:hypothetical protein
MKKITLLLAAGISAFAATAQVTPDITSWLQDTVTTGTYYMQNNSTPISNSILVNCQRIEYSTNSVYVTTQGVPSYPTGPFLDGNPSQASAQNAIYQIPRNPVQNTGTLQSTVGGNIGIFINGVSLFDWRDGVAWNPATNALCGGPGNPMCPGGPASTQDWNRDAIPAEMVGFDCSKGHPAMGNYHHHQNPSAFNLDKVVLSNICNLYAANGLYMIDSTTHSPLIGFAYDGFPIYGAYAFNATNGTGGITRMKSGYSVRNITTRTTSPTGGTVTSGPAVNTTYSIGYFREDYEFIATAASDVLDEHNGRFCVTPEYPNGTYAYFATVDSNWNSAYPYAVGPTFYGTYANRKITSITEATTRFIPAATGISNANLEEYKISIYPNPASELIAIQIGSLVKEDVSIQLIDASGKVVDQTVVKKGSSIAYFDIQTVYSGIYFVQFSLQNGEKLTEKVIVKRD